MKEVKLRSRNWFEKSGKDGFIYRAWMKKQGIPSHELAGWILSPDAKLLGKIVTPERPANMAWGDEDGKTLYLNAHTRLYKIRGNTGGKFSWQ
ncbi:MAG: hypothetical protein ABI691_19205 [Ginsengibacter sp.]